MSSKGKGKEVAGKDSYGKRKRDSSGGNDKTGGRKRKNPNVVQFFDDVAAEIDDDDDDFSDDSLFGDDFFVDEFPTELKVKSEPGKAHNLPFLPKEEEMNEEELDKMFEERYRSGSGFVTYAEDNYETKRSVQRDIIMPSAKEPTIWKVKCMVGREKHSAFCLMQKFVDLNSLGTKLQIISAFALEHIKGFIYMEADKQNDVVEACKGLCSIYSSRVALVPLNEISHLLSVRSKCNGVSVGMWARVKSGKYKGDLAQVVDVNDARKKATVKLLPRIDLQVLTEKFGGGVTAKKTTSPAPRLISSYELEEFRPLIQYRRDRDTNKVYEVLDGLMLKDGYLYKKVSIDSLSFWGVTPSKDELQMFESSQKDESDNVEWLSQLYGGERKKRNLKTEKGGGKGGKGGKGEGSSGSSMGNGFEVHDLVCFGRKDFGVIIGMEKDDYYKILKDSPGGPVLVSLESNELKTALSENKFTALDQHKKSISISDTVKILEGPLQGRQGIVKQIYRGTIFLYDENEEQNGGYFCSRSQMCEKVKLFDDVFNEKGGKSGTSGFEDFMSSPKSPLSPKKPWQARENNDFNRGDKEGMFSVGQSLRIRVGPLKGYLCRVLAIRRSDITVKLDSKQKVLTVKCEHLSEVRGKSSAFSLCEDPDSTSIKPFDMLGNQGCSTDWNGAGASAEGDGWNAAGGAPADGSSWPAFPASGAALEHDSANAFGSMDNDLKKDSEVADAAWDSRVTSNHNSSWGTVTDGKTPANSDQVGSWGNRGNCLNNATTQSGFGSIASGSWAKTELLSGDQAGSSKDSGDKWGNDKFTIVSPSDASGSWEKSKSLNEEGSWGKGKNVTGSSTSPSTWGKAVKSQDEGNDKRIPEDSWGKSTEKCSSINDSDGSRADWKSSSVATENQTRGWGNSGGSWSQKEAGNNDEASGWKKAKSNDSQAENWANKSNPGETKDFDGGKSNNSWNNEHTGGWSKTKDFDGGKGNNSWNKPNTSGEDNISNQNKGWGGGKEMGASGDKWNSSKAIDGDRGASGPSGSQSSGWNTPKVSQDMPSSWNPKSADIEKEVENKNRADGWNSAKTLDGGSAAGWGQSSGWKSGNGDAGGGRGGGGYGGDGGGRYGGRGGGGGGGGGGNCYKCGESGHFSRECPSAGGGGRGGGGGGGNCYKCGESGHFSRECPSAGGGGGGGGGGNCYKCGESGHFSRECPSAGSGGGGGGGGNCYKCGESGHFSRECPSAGGGGRGGGGGGGNCYKCGESGHFSRECPSAGGGGGGGGGNCYKCGESGHFSRECPSAGSGGRGGGGGGNCYKCGESGHFARECPSAGGGGGGGGGGSCYKCGESGHFARECPSAGGGGGGGSSAQAGGWGANKAGGWSSAHAGGWNKGPDSANEGGSSKGQAGGWGSGDNAAHAGRSKPEAGGWGSNQVGGSNSWNQSAGANETGDGKGQASGWGANKPGSSAQAGGWNKGPDSINEGGGSKGQAGGWGANKAGSSSGAQVGGWNKGTDSTNEAGSNKGQAGGWGSGDNAQAGRSNPQAGGWGTNQVGGSSSWNQSAGANETGDSKGQATGWGANKSGSSAQAGGWNKGPDSTNGAGSSQGQAGGWGANKAGSSSGAQAGGWNKGPDSTNEAGSNKGQVGGWGSGDNAQAGCSNPEAGGWGANQVGGSNSWTQSAGANDTGDGKGQAGGWG